MQHFYAGIRSMRFTVITLAGRPPGTAPGKLIEAVLNRMLPEIISSIAAINLMFIDKARAFAPVEIWIVGDNNTLNPVALEEMKRETGVLLI